MRKFVIFAGALVIFGIGAAVFLLTNNSSSDTENFTHPLNESWTIKDGYSQIDNQESSYRFQYRSSLFVTDTPRDDFVHILDGNTIALASKPSRGYQLPQVSIISLDRSIMGGMSLENWVKYASSMSSEDIQSDHERYRYLTNGYKVISEGKIFFLVDLTGFSNTPPILLFDNGNKLIEVASYWADDLYFEILQDFQVKFDDGYLQLTNEEVNIIKTYYEENDVY